MLDTLTKKERQLCAILRDMSSCVVAFSGGVDSALLSAIATSELGASAISITAVSASFPERERIAASAFTASIGARHEFIETHEVEDPQYAANPVNRCYFCKSELYAVLTEFARERGFSNVADGFNRDDRLDVRPGRGAAIKYLIRSPLDESGMSKVDVRNLARRRGLSVWEKPAMACLSSRVPHGQAINTMILRKIEQSEDALIAEGFDQCRVRHHGDVARIEVPEADLLRIMNRESRNRLVAAIQAAGYRHVTLDLTGYCAPYLRPSKRNTISLL